MGLCLTPRTAPMGCACKVSTQEGGAREGGALEPDKETPPGLTLCPACGGAAAWGLYPPTIFIISSAPFPVTFSTTCVIVFPFISLDR